MDPRHSGPVGGGCMKSDVGHRKYVFVKDMASDSWLSLLFKCTSVEMPLLALSFHFFYLTARPAKLADQSNLAL